MEEAVNNGKDYWYVLRCYPGKEKALQDEMRNMWQVETFVPMQHERKRDAHGRFCWVSKCALTGYVFLHTTQLLFKEMEKSSRKYWFMKHKVDALWKPIIVPDRDMESFIRVAGSKEERVAYVDPNQLRFKKGDRVRVVAGPFVGVEGEFLQIGGKHEKRVVIQLAGLVAVATAAIPASMVEKIG
ncbi:MAG: UpxY family transcription antiterminator [Bacteroidales bacterium]|nr:UpxY family transcription antiterminator [Bacteroidales bacterium]